MNKKLIYFLTFTLFFFSFLNNTHSVFAQTGEIQGKVTDVESGEGIPFANVSTTIDGKLVGAQTDFDGFYTIEPLPIGEYEIKVSYVGYQKQIIQKVLIEAGKTTELSVELLPLEKQIKNFTIPHYCFPIFSNLIHTSADVSTGILQGKIIDPTSRKGIPFVNIYTTIDSTQTRFEGLYIMRLPVGQHDIKVSYLGYQEKVIQNVIIETGKTTTFSIALKKLDNYIENFVICDAPCILNPDQTYTTGTLKGKITEAEGGEGMPFANVSLMANGTLVSTQTDFDGLYKLQLPIGQHDIKASYVEYQEKVIQNVIIEADKTTELLVVLEPLEEQLKSFTVENICIRLAPAVKQPTSSSTGSNVQFDKRGRISTINTVFFNVD